MLPYRLSPIVLLLVALPCVAQTDGPTDSAIELPNERSVGDLEQVALLDGDMPTGITVSPDGRIFICIPRWERGIETTVAEIVDGSPVAFPSEEMQDFASLKDSNRFISVQSVVVGPAGRLWILDTGRPLFRESQSGGPKLMAVDLASGEVEKAIVLPPEAAFPTTYLNDVRFDLSRGDDGLAFITDSSSQGGIIVVDLASGNAWRRLTGHRSVRPEKGFLPIVEAQPLMARPAGGEPQHIDTGSDGIAIGAAGERLVYTPLAGRRVFSVSINALADRTASDEDTTQTIVDHGDRGFASDGLESDAAGFFYFTNYEDSAVSRWKPGGRWETIAHHPTMLWPDTLAVATDGYLYMTCNQLHRQGKFHGGEDLRERPFVIYRTKIGNQPVRLR
jgi:sugar lactone lactonase YvrE